MFQPGRLIKGRRRSVCRRHFFLWAPVILIIIILGFESPTTTFCLVNHIRLGPTTCVFVSSSDSVKKCKKIKKVVDKPFKGWYYSQRRREQDRHNKNNSETIMRIVAIIKTI